MKSPFFFSLLLFTAALTIGSSREAFAEPSLLSAQKEPQIIVNNRILAKANGKAISVIDLMKKMDMLFYRQFPQYSSSSVARYQFYLANWKSVLTEMIDKELILADAEESKLVVSAGDIRQEMEQLFGPNIIENLDKAGLSFAEAYEMVRAEIIIRRMMYFRVQAKAIAQATPFKIREHYDKIAKDTIRDNEWVYRVITIRHRDPTKAADMGHRVHTLVTEDKVAFEDLLAKLQSTPEDTKRQPSVNISEELSTKEKELSQSYKTTLSSLESGGYSLPISQKSRADNTTVVRIFYLKEMVPGGAIPFKELEAKIKDQMISDAIEKESEAYLGKMRQHFDIQDNIIQELVASDFQPFVLK